MSMNEKISEKYNSSKKTNPWSANQYQLDPRQKLCWEFYVSPKSETFANAKRSAIRAGYTDGSADTITETDWFCGRLWRLNSLFTGEKKAKELLEIDLHNGGDKVDVGIARMQADLTKFIMSTQGRNDGYSTKTETDITSGGEKIEVGSAVPALEALRQEFEAKLKKELIGK